MKKTILTLLIIISSLFLVSCSKTDKQIKEVIQGVSSLYLNNQDINNIENSLNLVTKSEIHDQAIIKWSSSKTNYLSNDGIVVKAEYGDTKIDLTLKVTLKKNTKSVIYHITIKGIKSLEFNKEEVYTKITSTTYKSNEVTESKSDLKLTSKTDLRGGLVANIGYNVTSTSISIDNKYISTNNIDLTMSGIKMQSSSATLYNQADGNIYANINGLEGQGLADGKCIFLEDGEQPINPEAQMILLSLINFNVLLSNDNAVKYLAYNTKYELSFKEDTLSIKFLINKQNLEEIIKNINNEEINNIDLNMFENVIASLTIEIKDDYFKSASMELESDILIESQIAKLTDKTTSTYLGNTMPQFPLFDDYIIYEPQVEDIKND